MAQSVYPKQAKREAKDLFMFPHYYRVCGNTLDTEGHTQQHTGVWARKVHCVLGPICMMNGFAICLCTTAFKWNSIQIIQNV